jgi:hypothetical protein
MVRQKNPQIIYYINPYEHSVSNSKLLPFLPIGFYCGNIFNRFEWVERRFVREEWRQRGILDVENSLWGAGRLVRGAFFEQREGWLKGPLCEQRGIRVREGSSGKGKAG